MLKRLLRVCGIRVREAGESCGACRHFVDHADPSEPDDDDDIQKCAYLIDTLGFEKALEIDPYGGPWTHRHSWCRDWEPGPSLWQREEPKVIEVERIAVSDDQSQAITEALHQGKDMNR